MHENKGLDFRSLAEERTKSAEVVGNARVKFRAWVKECASCWECNGWSFRARKRVRKLLRIKDGFSRSCSNLAETCAGTDDGTGRRTGSELCERQSLLTNMKHHIMHVNSITYTILGRGGVRMGDWPVLRSKRDTRPLRIVSETPRPRLRRKHGALKTCSLSKGLHPPPESSIARRTRSGA
jgi:hypothetical protein